MPIIDRLMFACRQAAGIAGNCERGNLLVDAAECLEECRETGAALAQVIVERDKALEERAEANRAALRFANREAEFCRILSVADGGASVHDWAVAIGRLVEQRDRLQKLVAELMDETFRSA